MGTLATHPSVTQSPVEVIKTLRDLVGGEMTEVDREIEARLRSAVDLIPKISEHLICSGGKRLRPLLTLAAAKLCGYSGSDHIRLAAAVEFIHTATLLHDDVVDVSPLRRGAATANVIWGNPASVLVGDFLFSRAFELMVEVGNLDVLGILSRTSSIIAEGEVMQLAVQQNLEVTLDIYLKVIESKTAALFAAAAEVGAVVADRPKAERDAARAYGRNLGVAYQLVDDALDYSGRQRTLGKAIGDDFREGKMTLPVVLAFTRAKGEERAFWRRTIALGDQKDGDFERALSIMERMGAIPETLACASRYAERARQDLEPFPDSAYKAALLDLAEFSVSRGY